MNHFILKLGTRVVSKSDGSLADARLKGLISECAAFWRAGKKFAIVSSGAIGLGRKLLNLETQRLSDRQAAAAVGQSLLMRYYFEAFQNHGIHVAQVLVSAEDFSKQETFFNLKTTLERLFKLGVIPILNENDSVSVSEITESTRQKSFGDNDGLSAIIASKLGAELLVLLTDVDGVYLENPTKNPRAKKIQRIENFEDLHAIETKGKSESGRGGMESKLRAAKLAALGGCTTVIASGFESGILGRIFSPEPAGTWIFPAVNPIPKISGKKKWIATSSGFKGILVLNEGAILALKESAASLLPVGLIAAKGKFQAGDVVSLQNEKGDELGRGLAFYSSTDVLKILGKRSPEIRKTLGAEYCREVVHRDNLVLYR